MIGLRMSRQPEDAGALMPRWLLKTYARKLLKLKVRLSDEQEKADLWLIRVEYCPP